MAGFFDLSKPQAMVFGSPMGGGWIVASTEECKRVLRDYFGDDEIYLPPIERTGWIVEPHQSGELAQLLITENMAWEVA